MASLSPKNGLREPQEMTLVRAKTGLHGRQSYYWYAKPGVVPSTPAWWSCVATSHKRGT